MATKKTTKKAADKAAAPDAAEEKKGVADIAETLRSLKTKFGDEAIMTLDETKHVDIDSISTGSIGLDDALGIGGLPRGRIVEIYGPESSGKTTLSLHAVAEAQKTGGICAFIDAEHAMDPEYAKALGVKLDYGRCGTPDGPDLVGLQRGRPMHDPHVISRVDIDADNGADEPSIR